MSHRTLERGPHTQSGLEIYMWDMLKLTLYVGKRTDPVLHSATTPMKSISISLTGSRSSLPILLVETSRHEHAVIINLW